MATPVLYPKKRAATATARGLAGERPPQNRVHENTAAAGKYAVNHQCRVKRHQSLARGDSAPPTGGVSKPKTTFFGVAIFTPVTTVQA